jgi:hypothetical protein
MDVIINWFILIIIFVFDPLAVALVVAFNNAMKIDKGETDKKKVVEKRELYGEEPDREELLQKIVDNDQEMGLWDNTLNDELEDEEWDEDHALDEVLNDMVSDEDMEELNEDLFGEEDEEEPTEIVEEDKELANLKRDTSRRGIDLDGDGTVDGYDTDGDGLIDEPAPASSKRAQYVMNEVPYYARGNFDWGDRKKWINNQNAVNYWLTYIKNDKDTSYPTDFDSKTY